MSSIVIAIEGTPFLKTVQASPCSEIFRFDNWMIHAEAELCQGMGPEIFETKCHAGHRHWKHSKGNKGIKFWKNPTSGGPKLGTGSDQNRFYLKVGG
jgi:hypothetical protein